MVGYVPKNQKRQTSQVTYAIKAQLDRADPPIWRNLRLPGATPLDALHRLIQAAFGWEDAHLHQFSVGDPYRSRVVYEPAPEEDIDLDLDLDEGPERVDESTVTVAELAPHTGDWFTYLYDFGDSWTHTITVESVDEPDSVELLPRCTDGRRMAPFEDSGGVSGWAEKVDAARDDSHPDHADVRGWLGLAPGQDFDPAQFDKDAIAVAISSVKQPSGD
ncbi:MAG: hypothetical protein GEV10_29565 [Streptosporangiales bacterium]|nr:hypothetical protein [Streptosporangiales bacterium]